MQGKIRAMRKKAAADDDAALACMLEALGVKPRASSGLERAPDRCKMPRADELRATRRCMSIERLPPGLCLAGNRAHKLAP
eukprot:CAMPEP_0179047712 /NCGR_PEP_ID=MMETSP0796-20121207/19337_1 /TAXON_ID=73915 /ORGANISM="Pyrodinium bahamense, Strain pbaha01" /LENGTH=80 /DNA_ID=CAMNT_0020744163 /DNA_START=176 /DNA_END=418 /DNA_ORIENTATION=+